MRDRLAYLLYDLAGVIDDRIARLAAHLTRYYDWATEGDGR